jgi:hypothetical protein
MPNEQFVSQQYYGEKKLHFNEKMYDDVRFVVVQ